MKIDRVDHLAIAVKSIEEGLAFYRDVLGIACTGGETVEAEGVRVAFLPVGVTRLELLEPIRPDSAVAKFVESRGPGLHHVCFVVADLSAALDELRGSEVRVLSERIGAEGSRVAFLHPKSTGGVLIELREARPRE
ncbi:MAG: methylmalonyl-CoA epimerase [Acidobacteriota bacterium]